MNYRVVISVQGNGEPIVGRSVPYEEQEFDEMVEALEVLLQGEGTFTIDCDNGAAVIPLSAVAHIQLLEDRNDRAGFGTRTF